MQLKSFLFTLTIWNLTIGKTLTSCFNKRHSCVNDFQQRLSDKELEQLLRKARELVDLGNLVEALAIYQQVIVSEQANLQALKEIASVRKVFLSNQRVVNNFQNPIVKDNNYSQSLFETKSFKYYYNLLIALNQRKRIEEIMTICDCQ